MAVEASVPASVAESVTAVPVGTVMLVPLCPPPEREVVTEVGWVVGEAHRLDLTGAAAGGREDWLAVSPEYTACQ